MEERERMLDTIMEMQKWNGIKDEQIETLEQENQVLKYRWQKLKEFIIKFEEFSEELKLQNAKDTGFYRCGHFILTQKLKDKMQELEKE